MKSYTDLQQSKKLAKILPLESADMCYKCIGEDPYDACLRPYSEWKEEYKGLLVAKEVDVIPCWILAALLNILPNYHITNNGITGVVVWSMDIYSKEHPNLVDACYEMILKLRELKLL